jgi:hypothetical protein
MTVDEYAALYASDQEANNAARLAGWEAGEARPQGLLESMAANWKDAHGERFEDSPLARSRLEGSLPKHAQLGAEAYVLHRNGNAYTRYLKARFG